MEVYYKQNCYYLDGSGGKCVTGYELAPICILLTIASDFATKTYRSQVSDSCCVFHNDVYGESNGWVVDGGCNAGGQFSGAFKEDELCVDYLRNNVKPKQLTLCKTITGTISMFCTAC